MVDLLNNSPTPASAPEGMPAELAFLEGKGEDVTDLRAELETMLRREPTAPVLNPPLVQPLQADARLPIREDGTVIDRREPATTVPGQAQPAPAVSQEQALDPYSPGGTKTPAGDIDDTSPEPEPGEVMLDAEGKVRDAKTGRYVPHQAMQAERVRRKELEAELSRKDELVARATERLNVLQEIMHGQEQQQKAKEAESAAPVQEAEIDPEVDIFGWAKQQRSRAEAAERKLAEIAEQNQKQYGEISTQNRYRQDITTFAGKTQDFFDAYKFVSNMRQNELKALGFTDERQIASQLAAEERALVQTELAKGGSPAARLYALAKAKGFTGAAPVQQQQPAPVQALPPVQQTPAQQLAQQLAPVQQQQQQVPQPSQEGRDQVQRIQNGVNASATLSGAGGAPGEGLTVQQLAEMPDDQFDVLVAKIGRKNLDRMLGGR